MEVRIRYVEKQKGFFAKLLSKIPFFKSRSLRKLCEDLVELLKKESPGRGTLKSSWRYEILDESHARVFTTYKAAHYQYYGTRPSPGRYVPAIGRRLVRKVPLGVHPGVKRNLFIDRALLQLKEYDKLQVEIRSLLKEVGE